MRKSERYRSLGSQAMEELFVRTYGKGGGLFIVEGAANSFATFSAQRGCPPRRQCRRGQLNR